MVVLPSVPLNKISLSAVSALITKSEDTLLKLPNEVPPSFNIMSVPSASRIISPDESSVKSPVDSINEPEILANEAVELHRNVC